jgi:DNA-binding MarR family transcriptional regulator
MVDTRICRRYGDRVDGTVAQPQVEFRHDPASLVVPLSALVRWSSSGFFDQIAERSGIRLDRSALAIVAALRSGLEIRQAELAVLVGVERSTLSRQVAGVLRLGLVAARPDPNDKRASLLSLTNEGNAVKNAIAATWADLVSELVDGWSEQEKADLHRLLTKLVDSMQNSYTNMAESKGLEAVLPAYLFDNRVFGVRSTWSRSH